MVRRRLLQSLATILVCALGVASATGTQALESSCTPAQKLAGGCPNASGSVNGDGVDIRGSVNVPGTGTGTGRGGTAVTPPPPPPLRDGYTVTAPITLTDLVNFTPVAGIAHMEPNGWMIVGLDTNFYATVESGVQTGLLLDLPASVRFSVERYRWTYGDGNSATRSTSGSRWAALGREEFDPTATSHVYRAAGSYSIDLAIDYSAEYQYAGGPWVPISGSIPVAANRLVAAAGNANTVLVGRDCAQHPSGPGC